jgi:hypothetical protein
MYLIARDFLFGVLHGRRMRLSIHESALEQTEKLPNLFPKIRYDKHKQSSINFSDPSYIETRTLEVQIKTSNVMQNNLNKIHSRNSD